MNIKIRIWKMLVTPSLGYLRDYHKRIFHIDPVLDPVFYFLKIIGLMSFGITMSLSATVGIGWVLYRLFTSFTNNQTDPGGWQGFVAFLIFVTVPAAMFIGSMTLVVSYRFNVATAWNRSKQFYDDVYMVMIYTSTGSLYSLVGTGEEQVRRQVPVDARRDIMKVLFEFARNVSSMSAVLDRNYEKEKVRNLRGAADRLGIIDIDLQAIYAQAKASV